MTCPRCAGFMCVEPSLHHRATESLLDQFDLTTVRPISLHCLNCGNYLDAVVLANRAKQADERRLVAQAETIAMMAALTPAGVSAAPARKGQ